MEDFALVEADFQQYYTIDLDAMTVAMQQAHENGQKRGFLRYARLFAGLPVESRTIREYAPAASWSMDNETFSRMLLKLDEISAILYNTNRKKGSQPAKVSPQFEPKEVKEAKKAHAAEKGDTADQVAEETKDFFRQMNKGMDMA